MSQGTITDFSTRIADMAADDRPREKALARGIEALSDTELIAILLGGGLPGKPVTELSKELYNSAGQDLDKLARKSIRQMARDVKGIGPAKAVVIAAALELGARRRLGEKPLKPQIRCSSDVYTAIRDKIENRAVEQFWMLAMTQSNCVEAAICISTGGTTATVVEPKVVIKNALDHLAAGIILAHNHPSGNLMPSPQDNALTRKIKDAAAMFDIKLLDHLIVTTKGYYSYADDGQL